MIIINSCLRIFVLYCSFLYNILNINEILPLIYESRDNYATSLNDIQIVREEEKKKDRDCESNILVKRNGPAKSPRRESFFKEESTNNKFPILLQGKVKLPIFISFERTTENEKGNFLQL